MASSVFVLVGLMLGACEVYQEGELETTDGERVRREAFWHLRGAWRVERDDGIVVVTSPRAGSATTLPDGRVERGPAMSPALLLPAQLLQPRHALIWGRPGEDWRLTGEVEPAGPGRLRVALEPTDLRAEQGHLVVDEVTGVLHELALGPLVTRLLRLSDVGEPTAPELFVLPAVQA